MKSGALRVFLLLLYVTQTALCCSLLGKKLQQVSPDLTVVVTHRKAPVAGIKVEVVPEKSLEPVFTGLTDEKGTVLIQGLMVGKYWLSASHQDFEAGKEWIEVVAVPDDQTKSRFDFDWADWSYQTRRVAGALTGLVPGETGNKLMDIVHPKETVYSGVAISLRNAFGPNEYRTVSDSNGAFVIDQVPDGVYVLTIAGGMKAISGTAEVTRQVIDVTAATTRDSLPLQLRDNGCYRVEFELRDN